MVDIELVILWQQYAPQITIIEFFSNFNQWCAHTLNVNAYKLSNEKFFILMSAYCKTLK